MDGWMVTAMYVCTDVCMYVRMYVCMYTHRHVLIRMCRHTYLPALLCLQPACDCCRLIYLREFSGICCCFASSLEIMQAGAEFSKCGRAVSDADVAAILSPYVFDGMTS